MTEGTKCDMALSTRSSIGQSDLEKRDAFRYIVCQVKFVTVIDRGVNSLRNDRAADRGDHQETDSGEEKDGSEVEDAGHDGELVDFTDDFYSPDR